MKSELLVQFDGIGSNTVRFDNDSSSMDNRILILAATNFPWDLDEAVRNSFFVSYADLFNPFVTL